MLSTYKDNEFNIDDVLDLKIKPNDGIYKVTSEGLKVNKINLVEHDAVAITEKESGTKLYTRLHLWFTANKNEKLIVVGHNVGFDINRITNTLMSKNTWNQFVSYRVLDTGVISQFLRIHGKLPNELNCGLVDLTEYFNCKPLTGKAHESDYDCISTMNVLEHLLKL
jgi:DNA polymerase III alpha subunit (gram-positive type)